MESRSRILHEIHPNEMAVVAAVTRLGAYADSWLREPEDWQPNPGDDPPNQWKHLLRHLLARFPVPEHSDSAWQVPGNLMHFDRDCWCVLGYGRSLRHVDGFPSSISKKVLHQALSATKGQNLAEAIWHAQLQQLNVSAPLREAVMASPVSKEVFDHSLWARLIAKFATAEPAFAADFATAAAALTATKAHRGEAQVERLLVLPLKILIRHCQRFIAELLSCNGHLLSPDQVRSAAEKAQWSKMGSSTWKPMLGNQAVPFGKLNSVWHMDELCSLAALKQEGQTMHHCVAGYARRCKQGHSAIFSLRRDGLDVEGNPTSHSYATIEVHPAKRMIVQVRALRNRPINNSCFRMIQAWAHRNDVL